MCPWLVSFTCCLHLFTQKRTYPVESSVSPLQLLTLDSSLDLIWAAQQHFVRFQQVLTSTLGSHLVCSSHGWEVDKGSTAKHTEVVDVRHLPLKHFMGGVPLQVSYWSMVVDVGCMSERKFPPRVRPSENCVGFAETWAGMISFANISSVKIRWEMISTIGGNESLSCRVTLLHTCYTSHRITSTLPHLIWIASTLHQCITLHHIIHCITLQSLSCTMHRCVPYQQVL